MITVIGSINLDLIAGVARLPAPGETVTGSGFRTAPGGKGANQALAAARAGASVRMIGAVGRDAFAAEALTFLKREGIDLSGVRETELRTGTALILVDREGENMIAVVPGANGSLAAPDALGALSLSAGDHVLVQQEIPLETVAAVLEAAREVGAVSLLNVAPFHEEAAGLLELADYLIANETEFDRYADALSFEGGDREARMRFFAGSTGRTIVVTLGAEGVVAVTPRRFYRIAAMKISPVDTVGAGDAFCGYLGAGLAEGLGLEAALNRASVAGALTCLKAGAQPAIPLRDEVDRAIRTVTPSPA